MTSIAGKYQHYKNEDIDDYFTVVGEYLNKHIIIYQTVHISRPNN